VSQKTRLLLDLQDELQALSVVSQDRCQESLVWQAQAKLKETEKAVADEEGTTIGLEHMLGRSRLTAGILKDRVTKLTEQSKLVDEKLTQAKQTLEESEATRTEAIYKVKYLQEFIRDARLTQQISLEDRVFEAQDAICSTESIKVRVQERFNGVTETRHKLSCRLSSLKQLKLDNIQRK
jgi:hypothetical protein